MIRKILTGLFCLCLFSALPVQAQVDVSVLISGVDKELEDNIRLFLSIEQQKNSDLLSQGRLQRLNRKAPQEISKALQPFGYYKSQVDAKLVKLDGGGWQANYHINPGPRIPVGVFDFKLNRDMSNDPAFNEFIDSIRLKSGAAFKHVEYERIKSELARLASERGYVSAKFTRHQVEVDLDTYKANVYLYFEGGVRYQFGEVTFSTKVLDDALLRRYLTFKQGDPFHLDRLLELQQALNDSDFFSVVEVSSSEPDEATLQVPIDIRLTPRKRHRLSLGLGYGTDSGARAKFGWQIPRYNEHGHHINSQASVSELGYSLSTQYTVPIYNPRTDQLVYSAGQVNEKTDSSESTLNTVGVSINRKKGLWRATMSLNYQEETFTIADVDDQSRLFIPGINGSRIWGNEFWGNQVINFFDGVRLDLGFRLAATDLLSDVGFSQVNGSIKSINRLGESHRIISRGRLGYTSTEDFELLPSSIRYFAGGAQSVRGYSYQSLGPVDADGDVIGGQYLLEGSIEYEYSINPRWGIAVFIDAGNAVDNLEDDLEQGAGFGLRWNSPIGPVRFDFASAISQEDKPWRIHINIGPDL
jgi:translocation and assembly module TamA